MSLGTEDGSNRKNPDPMPWRTQMPGETAATRTLRSQLAQLEGEAKRATADQQAATDEATNHRRQAEGVRDTLMQGGVPYLEPRSREMLTQYRDQMSRQ